MDNELKQFLISCDYDYYCQGYEKTTGIFLSTGTDFDDACIKLRTWLQYTTGRGINARNFVSLTVN